MTVANPTLLYAETADIETSSADYARRFSGQVGEWFLKVQEDATLSMLANYPGTEILDVGGGHGQLTEALVRHGYQVTVFGSDPICKNRIHHFVERNLCKFEVGNLLTLPYSDRSFDVVLSYRLLPHVTHWQKLLSELARVAQSAVIIDYPEVKSINYIAPYLFRLKKKMEGNTRPFTCFRQSDLAPIFKSANFYATDRYPEFLLPMVLHRKLGSIKLSSALESFCRKSGLTEKFGSPVILKLERQRG